MNQLEFILTQGSTPRIELLLPFELGGSDVAYATFAQAGRSVLEYAYNGTATPTIAGTGSLTRGDDHSMLVLTMTQADTLALKPGDAELQVRVKTGAGADTFFPLVGAIVKAQRQGVIV